MAWQAEVGSGTDRATTYHDFVTKLVAFLTSQHVDTVAVNNAGSGYVTGDVVTLTHAGAYLDARFEVTAVAGAITALRILTSGAFANRATSATVSAGGANYAVGNIIEVQGGTNREKAKFSVATLSGSAVATVTLFETGGAYSSTPSNPAATTKIGPTAGTGSGATLTVSYTGLIGTTGLAVTGGTGTGATVDITLAETGWAVDGRNTNNTTFNGLTNEKQVVVKGDAAGRTNKPYIGIATATATSGVNTRYAVIFHPMIAHNQALASLAGQPGVFGDPGVWATEGLFLLCDENQAQQMDFWITASDRRFGGVLDTNSGAATSDDRQLHSFHQGYYDSYGTEVEDPYPMFCHAASRAFNIDPSVSTTNITSIIELLAPPTPGTFNPGAIYYRSDTSEWVFVRNSANLASDEEPHVMLPLGNLTEINSGFNNQIGYDGVLAFHLATASLNRSSPSRRLLPIPGTTPFHYPIPLIIASVNGTTQSDTLDFLRGSIAGFFWVYNTDSAGATISNFALDYITVGTDRYRVFHTHVQRQLYHYFCIKEDV